jgi:hypothetical protein|nr:MAG TPA: hypothetical protein [Caudoviricetes sp.]
MDIKKTLMKTSLKLKKHSPEILIVAGVIGTVASTVMACKATTKLGEIMDNAKDDIEAVHEAVEHPEDLPQKYTAEDGKKDLTIVYTQTALRVAKLYLPAVALGALSLTAIIKSHDILKKRNVALAAAYTAADKGFKEYRNRVVERFGNDVDKELRYNVKAKEFEHKVVNDDGTEETVVETVNVASIDDVSDFAKYFNKDCAGWSDNAEKNLFFLKRQQDFANELLEANGYLFLNEVYDMLGIPRSKAGQVVGWVYDKNVIAKVDFGIYTINREENQQFVNGLEKNVLLDFNVDGNILDLL